MTRIMSKEEYLYYSKSRKISFSGNKSREKFRDWLLSGDMIEIYPSIKIDAFALEALQYFATETVSQVSPNIVLLEEES